MKKMCLTLALSMGITAAASAIDFVGGVYQIRTPQDLVDFSTIVNEANSTFYKGNLLNDIDMSSVENFTPIGLYTDGDGAKTPFLGVFYGNGHVVKNLTVRIADYEVGLFSRIAPGSDVRDLGVVDSYFESTNGIRTGAIGGEIHDVTLFGCFGVNNVLVTTNDQKGGVAGEAASTKLSRCYTDYPVLAGAQGELINNSKQNVPISKIMSGELCFEMNNFHTFTPLWRQDLKAGGYPVVSANGPQVSKLIASDTYTNDHNFVDGICRECVDFFYEENYMTPDADGYYLISTPEQMMWFCVFACHFHQNANAKLTADIDMSGITDYYGIGNYENEGGEDYAYRGTFNGQGHIVSNLTAYREDPLETGFFGRASHANISNLGFTGDITITNTKGIRCGVLGGEIETCSVNNVFVRANSITYNTTNSQTGPFGGETAWSTFSNSYTTEATFSGGMGTFNNCYNNANGDVNAMAPTGELCAMLGTGWYQNIDNGQPVDDYPTLDASHGIVYLTCDGSHFSNNSGHNYQNGICQNCSEYEEPGFDTQLNAYTIGNLGQMIRFSEIVNTQNQSANGSLICDIDMQSSAAFSPIGLNNDGDQTTPFCGTFYGNNHVVRNLYVKTNCEGGLFSRLRGGKIYNLGVENAYIESTANLRCGAIVGEHHDNAWMYNCYANGNIQFVTGHSQTNALCGEAHGGHFVNCYTTLPKIACDLPNGGSVENCYEGVTESFASTGELCCKLGDAFRQTLGEDVYPVLDKTHSYVKEVSEAGYATMYVPDVVQIPEDVSIFTGEYEETWLKLNPVEDVIPAAEPVVLKASPGFYGFKPGIPDKEDYIEISKLYNKEIGYLSFLNGNIDLDAAGTLYAKSSDIYVRFSGNPKPIYYDGAARLYSGNRMVIGTTISSSFTKVVFDFESNNAPRNSNDIEFSSSGQYDYETMTWTGEATRNLTLKNKKNGPMNASYLALKAFTVYGPGEVPANIAGNVLKGAAEDIEAAGKYVLAKPDGEQVGFYLAETGIIKAGKAYLEVPEGTDIKAFYFSGDEATGIASPKSSPEGKDFYSPLLQEGAGEAFNLAGQRLSKMQKGINIIGGKKVFVK